MAGFYWALFRKAVSSLLGATGRTRTAAALFLFFLVLFNGELASRVVKTWTGFSPWYSLWFLILFFFIEVARVNYHMVKDLEPESLPFRLSQFESFLRMLEVQLQAEIESQASHPTGLDEAKMILASVEPRVLDLYSSPTLASRGEITNAVNTILADLKRLQRHQLYMDGGKSSRAFWESINDVMERLKGLPTLIRKTSNRVRH